MGKNYAHVVGLGAAAEYALEWGLDLIWHRIQFLADLLRQSLQKIPQVQVIDQGKVQCGIVSFSLQSIEVHQMQHQLRQLQINTSVADREDALMSMDHLGFRSLLRASVHYYNTEEEINRFCLTLHRLLSQTSGT